MTKPNPPNSFSASSGDFAIRSCAIPSKEIVSFQIIKAALANPAKNLWSE
jgi:hypothetical protein